MKSSFSTYLLLSSCLLVLASGCGKDAGKSASAPLPLQQQLPMNPLVSTNMPATGQAALNNLKAWLAQPESNFGFRGTFIRKNNSINTFNFTGSVSLCILGHGLNCNPQVPAPTDCYIKNGDGINYDLGKPSNATCTVTQTGITKANNPALLEAVNGGGLNLLNVQVPLSGVYILSFGHDNYNVSKVYTIDTNVPSILNPVEVQDLASRTDSFITNLTPYQF